MCGATLKPSTWLANPAREPRPRIIRGYPSVQGRHLNPQHRVFIFPGPSNFLALQALVVPFWPVRAVY